MLGFRLFILWPCVLKTVDRLHSNLISSSVCGHWWCGGRQTNKQQPWIMQSVVNEETRTVASLQRGAILCTQPHPQLIRWALQTLCVVMTVRAGLLLNQLVNGKHMSRAPWAAPTLSSAPGHYRERRTVTCEEVPHYLRADSRTLETSFSKQFLRFCGRFLTLGRI